MLNTEDENRLQSKRDQMKVSHCPVNVINRGWTLKKLCQTKERIDIDMRKEKCDHIWFENF